MKSKLYQLIKHCEDNKIYLHFDYTKDVINIKTPQMKLGKYSIQMVRSRRNGRVDIDWDRTVDYICASMGWTLK